VWIRATRRDHRSVGLRRSRRLHILGCVDQPSAGSLEFEGHDVRGLTEAERSRIRLTRIGFVFQRFFLLPMLTAWENIELPQSEAGATKTARRARTRELLDYVGLLERSDHRPSQLSGGEMQRVAIARALANRRRCCSPTSPPASSTKTPVRRSPGCSIACTPTGPQSSSSRTIRRWRLGRAATWR
jgi:predicted ABC-type transport system involved in lysophospholipase L1 biosynthesis ATPase subunit